MRLMHILPHRPRWQVAIACTAIAGGLCLLAGPNGDGADHTPPAAAPGHGQARSPARAAPSAPGADLLDDALGDMARLFELGIAGDLHVDIDTKAALELLAAEILRQRSPDVVQRIERALRAGLPPQAAQEALTMVHNYLAYSKASAVTMGRRGLPDSFLAWRALVDEDATLRARHFDAPTNQALFGDQVAYTRYAMDIHAIAANPQLSPSAKSQRMQALYEQLAPEVAAMGSPPSAAAALETRINSLRQEGASDAQIQRERQPFLGSEASSALRTMEMHNGLWVDRYQAYARQKNAMLADRPPDPAGLVETLLSQHFEPEEVPAARAYDRMQERH